MYRAKHVRFQQESYIAMYQLFVPIKNHRLAILPARRNTSLSRALQDVLLRVCL